jgi:hypothetical protein
MIRVCRIGLVRNNVFRDMTVSLGEWFRRFEVTSLPKCQERLVEQHCVTPKKTSVVKRDFSLFSEVATRKSI